MQEELARGGEVSLGQRLASRWLFPCPFHGRPWNRSVDPRKGTACHLVQAVRLGLRASLAFLV